jgi:hypothetical protein
MDYKIPEVQRVKEKYPQYKRFNDRYLLNRLAEKFPAAYGDVQIRELNKLKERKEKNLVTTSKKLSEPKYDYSQFFDPSAGEGEAEKKMGILFSQLMHDAPGFLLSGLKGFAGGLAGSPQLGSESIKAMAYDLEYTTRESEKQVLENGIRDGFDRLIPPEEYQTNPKSYWHLKNIEKRKKLSKKLKTRADMVEFTNKQFLKKMKLRREDIGKDKSDLLGYDVGHGFTSVLSSIGLYALTGGSLVPALGFGGHQAISLYNESLEKDLPRSESIARALSGGGREALLEGIGLNFIMKYYGAGLTSAVIRGVENYIQEWSQTTGENILMNDIRPEVKSIFQGSGRAGLIGFLTGAGTSVVADAYLNNQMEQSLKRLGVDAKNTPELVDAIRKRQMEILAEVMEKVVAPDLQEATAENPNDIENTEVYKKKAKKMRVNKPSSQAETSKAKAEAKAKAKADAENLKNTLDYFKSKGVQFPDLEQDTKPEAKKKKPKPKGKAKPEAKAKPKTKEEVDAIFPDDLFEPSPKGQPDIPMADRVEAQRKKFPELEEQYDFPGAIFDPTAKIKNPNAIPEQSDPRQMDFFKKPNESSKSELAKAEPKAVENMEKPKAEPEPKKKVARKKKAPQAAFDEQGVPVIRKTKSAKKRQEDFNNYKEYVIGRKNKPYGGGTDTIIDIRKDSRRKDDGEELGFSNYVYVVRDEHGNIRTHKTFIPAKKTFAGEQTTQAKAEPKKTKGVVFKESKTPDKAKIKETVKPTPPIEVMHEVKLEDREGNIIVKKMGTRALMDLRENLEGNKAGIQIKEVNPIGSSEAGYWKIFDERSSLKGLQANLGKVLDVEAPFSAIGGKQTALAIKTVMSKYAAAEEMGLKAVSDLGKFALSRNDTMLLAFAGESVNRLSAADQKRLQPVIDHINDIFESRWPELQRMKPDTFVDQFPQSRIKRNGREIRDIMSQLKEVKNPRARSALVDRMNALKKEIKYFEDNDLKYMHIPVRIWLHDKVRNRNNFGSLMGRKHLSLVHFVQDKYIAAEDVDVRDILANYVSYIEQQKALYDVVKAAKADGLAQLVGKPGTEDFVSPPEKLKSFMKGYVVNPVFKELVNEYFGSLHGSGGVGKVLGIVKMMQFSNPVGLGLNNMRQMAMAGVISPNIGKYFQLALEDVKNQNERYFQALRDGIASTPYNSPFANFIKDLEALKDKQDNPVNAIVKTLQGMPEYAINPIKAVHDIYQTSWYVGWHYFDRIPRFTTFHALLDTGKFSPQEAAQLAAKYHGDYASVPPATRKLLNRLFFTPTFDIVMFKLYGEMLKGGIKTAIGKGNVTDKQMAKALVATAGIIMGKHFAMTRGLKMETQEFCRRYYIEVETDLGPKEVVVTYAGPENIWLRYAYGLAPAELPTNRVDKWARFVFNKANPVWRMGIMLLENKDEFGNEIYNIFDPTSIFVDSLQFLLSRSVRLLDIPDRRERYVDKVKIQALIKDLGFAKAQLIDKMLFSYMRNVKEIRQMGQIKQLNRQFNQEGVLDIIDLKSLSSEEAAELYKKRLNNYSKMLRNYLNKIREERKENEK